MVLSKQLVDLPVLLESFGTEAVDWIEIFTSIP